MVKHRRSRGGGYSTGPEMISPGYLVNQQYTGVGKDCAGIPVRSGHIDGYMPGGLPGLRGGKRRSYKKRGGTLLQVAHVGQAAQASAAVQPVPSELPQTHGGHGVPLHPVQQALPQASAQALPQALPPALPQALPKTGGRRSRRVRGGRYEISPGFLDPIHAIGASGPAPFSRIACEAGTTNALNPNRELQMATTAVPLSGGKRRIRGGAQQFAEVTGGSTTNFPVVHVGAADSMRYYAPTAGYRNDFEQFPSGGAVPGLTLQTPFDARSGNPACSTTGGGKHRVRFGGNHFQSQPAPVSALSVDQVMDRSDFDGSHGGLPVKFGGKRSRKRSEKRSEKRRRTRCKQHRSLRSIFGL